MLVETGDYTRPYLCLACDHNNHFWGDDAYYMGEEIRHAEREPLEPFGVLPSSAGEVGGRLNAHTKLLPFGRWEYDRGEVGLAIAEFLDEMSKFRRTFKLRQLAPLVEGERPGDLDKIDMSMSCPDWLWACHKVQPTKNVTAGKNVYLNPNYVHYDACGPSGEFEDESVITYWTMLHATVGHTPKHVVERNLGIDSVYDYDPDWSYRREVGRRFFANSLLIAKEWSGWSIKKTGRAFGLPRQTASDYINKYAELDEAPPDPSPYPSFGRSGPDRTPEIEWPDVINFRGETA